MLLPSFLFGNNVSNDLDQLHFAAVELSLGRGSFPIYTWIMTCDPLANSLPMQKNTYFLMFLVSIWPNTRETRNICLIYVYVIENDIQSQAQRGWENGLSKRNVLSETALAQERAIMGYSWKVDRFLGSACESSLIWCNIFTEICVYLEYSCGVLAIQVTKIAPPICALRSGNLMYIIVLINSTTPHSISSIPGKWGFADQLPMHILWGTISSCICWFVRPSAVRSTAIYGLGLSGISTDF